MTPGRQRSFSDDFQIARGAGQPVGLQDLAGFVGRLIRDREADFPQPVDGERHHGMSDVGRDLAGDAITFEKTAHQLGFGVVPRAKDDVGAQAAPLKNLSRFE